MNVKSNSIQNNFVASDEFIDPDDAPELPEDFFEKATFRIGDKIVSKEEFFAAAEAAIRAANKKKRTISR